MEKEVNKALLMELKRHIWISVSLFDAMKNYKYSPEKHFCSSLRESD